MRKPKKELISKQEVEDWNNGKLNEISNWYEDCETYESLRYYPELDITVSLRHIWEGYYNDDMIEQFQGVSKGRMEIEDIVEQWNEECLL